MAKRNRNWTKEKIQKRILEGKGQGHGKDYTPWLAIQDVPSRGVVTRVKSWTVGRIHHLMSNFERSYFYICDWSDLVLDIREQFPLLPLEKTLEIAEEKGFEHPRDPKTKEPIVMTTDFMLTVQSGNEQQFKARTLKHSKDITKRVLEKLTIEQKFYEDEGIDWTVVTDQHVPRALIGNIEWLHRAKYLEYAPEEIDNSIIDMIAPKILSEIQMEDRSLTAITINFDDKLGLPSGSSMFIVQHMLATKQWGIDMYKKINPSEILNIIEQQKEKEPNQYINKLG